MNMEKPAYVDVRDLECAINKANTSAFELKQKAEQLEKDAAHLRTEAMGWERAANCIKLRLEALATSAQQHVGTEAANCASLPSHE